MPFDRSKYPPYWKQFSLYIRKERAKDVCEQCGAENGQLGKKGRDGKWRSEDSIERMNSDVGEALYGDWDGDYSKVVLTVAHLDNEGGVCDCKERTGRKCAKPDHVLALCQACHLALDMPKHIANRRVTMANRSDAKRGLLEGMDV